MRIALSVLRYVPAVGGSTRVVQLLAEGLAARGHEVTLVTQEEPGSPPEETIAGVHVRRLGMRQVAGFRVPRGYLRLLRGLDADVFHLHGNRIWCADYYFPFARSFDWPQVVTPHNFYHYWMRRGLVRWLYYEEYLPGRLRAFDAYVALTRQEQELVTSWEVPPNRVHVIPNGIDLGEFQRDAVDRKRIRSEWGLGTPHVAVYTGGFYDNKRVDRLVRAVAATHGEWGLVAFGPDVPGHPYDQTHCEQLARELGARVRFSGSQPRSVLLDGLASADVYLQGSSFEGFGLSLLEAMAAGLPFIAFDAGAAGELAETGAGLVVADSASMAAQLATTIGRQDEMRRAALQGVRKYTVDRMVEETLVLYQSIQRAPTPRPPQVLARPVPAPAD